VAGYKSIPLKLEPNTTYYLSTTYLNGYTSKGKNIYGLVTTSRTDNANWKAFAHHEYGARDGSLTTKDDGFIYLRFHGMNQQLLDDLYANAQIQLEKGSTATAYEPYGIYADGMVETLRDSAGHTATAQMLLSVGDYKDEQNITTGAITRRVGVKVLDGTEGWASYQSGACWAASSLLKDKVSGNYRSFSTHYGWASSDVSNMQNNQFLLHGTQRVCIKDDRFETATGFRQFLADQYAAGTPVIVVYPLATPTTESVAGQTLQVQAGDNTLEITQASLNNLELEAQYEQGVQASVQEIEP